MSEIILKMEIERLTRERDTYRRQVDLMVDEAERLTRERDEARAERDNLRVQIKALEVRLGIARAHKNKALRALEEIAHLSDERDRSVWFSEAVDIARRATSTGEE